MIILEGPDQVGKTTAAMKLAKLMAPYVKRTEEQCYRHMTKPDPSFDHFESYLSAIGPHVQDRYHLGALVYGLMLGKGNYPNAQRMLLVQRYMRWRGVLTVIMLAEHDWLRAKLTARDEMYNPEQILLSNTGFMLLAQNRNANEPYSQIVHNVTRAGYPDDATIRTWFDMWKKSWVD